MTVKTYDEQMDIQMDIMSDMVLDALPVNDKSYVFYSAYRTSEDTGIPLNNLNTVAIRGKVIMEQEHDNFWDGDNTGEAYRSEIMENPTWLDLAVAANKMIGTVKDFHHMFFEGVYSTRRKTFGVKVYGFAMGS